MRKARCSVRLVVGLPVSFVQIQEAFISKPGLSTKRMSSVEMDRVFDWVSAARGYVAMVVVLLPAERGILGGFVLTDLSLETVPFKREIRLILIALHPRPVGQAPKSSVVTPAKVYKNVRKKYAKSDLQRHFHGVSQMSTLAVE
jgi:hypothetical protein